MRIECREDTVAVHTHYELVLLGTHGVRVALAEPRYQETDSSSPKLVPVFETAQLALSPTASRAAAVFAQGGLSLVELAEPRAVSRSTADAMGFLTDELLLSVRVDEDGKGPRGLFRGRHGGKAERIALPAAELVAWPEGRGKVWEGATAFQPGALSARCVMYSNTHGHVVVDSEYGLVVRLNRLGGGPTVHRVPAEAASSALAFAACATEAGFITVHRGTRGTAGAAVHHFGFDGKHLGALPVTGNVSDVGVSDGAALLLRDMSDDSGKLELVVAKLPTLEIIEVAPTRLYTHDGYPSLFARDGGRDAWAGNGTRLRRLMRSPRGWEDQPVKLDTVPLIQPTVMSAEQLQNRSAAASAGATTEPSASRSVVHPKFGVGRVVGQEGTGENSKLKIEFADGVRTLLARFVKDA